MNEYVGSGGVSTGGCASFRVTVFRSYPYGPGDVVYLAYRARKGVLERISIKRIEVKSKDITDGTPVVYVDQDNFLYNEEELCSESQAISYAMTYYTNLVARLEEMIEDCD